jgi:DNA-directed RNA polymerase specialized sigma24 family protein
MVRMILLQTLSPKQIEVAADFYYHGMTQKQIAAKRGVSRLAVAKLLSRARAHLSKFGWPEPSRAQVIRHSGRERNLSDGVTRSL